MVLGIEQLHALVKEKGLVTNLSERELTNPEGAGFDLRVGELYEVEGEGFMGVIERETPEMKLIAQYDSKNTVSVALKPNIYYVIKTMESVNLPENLWALPAPRSTFYRSGLYIFGGPVHPGYQGGLSMGIYNFRDKDFRLEMGSRVVNITFFEVKGEGNMYRGQWQGGRVTTNQKETQI